jgi:hypothetical protein
VPGDTWSVAPWTALPLRVGAATFTGRPASGCRIRGVAFDAALAEPSPFVAVTRTRIRASTSAAATMYLEVVAPPMAAQSEPSGLPPSRGQRSHWKAKLDGSPVHDPVLAVSVAPTDADPVMRGSAVFAGASCVLAPPPPGRARTVAADASAAAASVQIKVNLRVVRIARVLSSI